MRKRPYYKTLVDDFRVYPLGYKDEVIGFGVWGLGFRFYNTLVNSCKKQLNKSYKTLFKIL